jgi:AmmeMemoRadiSam system protein B
VAGTFYPGNPDELRNTVSGMLAEADRPVLEGPLRGLIVPHAGHIYSGPVAATAYKSLEPEAFADVVLIGPAHFEQFSGIAALDAAEWRTPLGPVTVAPIPDASNVLAMRTAYRREHSLEVQLPFLQMAMGDMSLTPLLTGLVDPALVTGVLAELVSENSLLLVSTDLSHYENYNTARAMDSATADAVVGLDAEALQWRSACGLTGLQAVLFLAQRRGWRVQLLDLRNSGDTAGRRGEVVGYGAFALVA